MKDVSKYKWYFMSLSISPNLNELPTATPLLIVSSFTFLYGFYFIFQKESFIAKLLKLTFYEDLKFGILIIM